jgi:CDP-diacylglycerol--glycerol-3-phosphate 3-phosphatidyltransferase
MSQAIFAHWPNRITALRFLGALALFWIMARMGDLSHVDHPQGRAPFAVVFWVFIAVALSDILDGYLARRFGWVSAFGRIADPFVDKILVLGVMVFLATKPWAAGWFPAWVVVVVMAREFLITGIRGYLETLGAQFPADWLGKVKMLVQCWAIGIVLGLAAFPFPPAIAQFWAKVATWCVAATVVTTVASGLSYAWKAQRILTGRGS